MFKFRKEQKVYDIAGVKIGGQPGQVPTVLMGSIFYHGHDIVEDEKKGKFDKDKAERLLKNEEELSDETGIPRVVDVCCSWPEAFEKYIDFVASTIEGPFAIDGTTAEVRKAGIKYVAEVGLLDRVIYNSITPQIKTDELETLKECGLKSAILLTLNTRNPTIRGRLEVLDKLLDVVAKANIQNVLIDTTVLDIPDPGPVSKTMYLIKDRYGLPVGAGIHNAVERWKKVRKIPHIKYIIASCIANTVSIVLGADFILYGPIENAKIAYFMCGLVNAYIAYSMMQEYGIRPLTRDHPLFKVFRR